MANHKSAEKRARQTITRNALNRARRSTIRTVVKQAEDAIASADAKDVVIANRAAESALARGAARGTLHRKTASRKASRLSRRAKVAKKA